MGVLNWISRLGGHNVHSKTIILTIKDKSYIPDYILKQYVTYAPKYNLQIFDDEDCKAFLKKHYGVDFVTKFESFQMGCHKAVFFRYAYLFKMGGIYLDVKTILIRPIEDIFIDPKICYIVQSINSNSIFNGIIHTPPRNIIFKILLMDMYHDTTTLNVINFLRPTYQMYKILQWFTSKPLVFGVNKMDLCSDVILYEERNFRNIYGERDPYGVNTYVVNDSKMLFKVRDHKYVPNYDMSSQACTYTKTTLNSRASPTPIQHSSSNVELVLQDNEQWLTNQNMHYEERTSYNQSEQQFPSYTKEICLTSRSAFGQDAMILNFFKCKKYGYYIDIGSGEGDKNNHTYLMDVELEWKGLCVDPYPLNMNARSCKVHKGVVYHSKIEVEFLRAGLKSGIRSYGEERDGEVVFRQASRTEDVLKKAEAPQHVDFLSVSVEGAELSVLQGLDFSSRRFETIMVNTGMREDRMYNVNCFMKDLGYTILFKYEEGIIFVAPKQYLKQD